MYIQHHELRRIERDENYKRGYRDGKNHKTIIQ